MARNLAVKGDHDLIVFDVSEDRINWLKNEAEGKSIEAAASPADIASEVDFIVTMLPSNPHVLDVYSNPKTGILSAAKSNSLFLDSSTIDPNVARQVAKMVTDTNKSTDIGHRLPIRGEHMVTVKHCIDENKLSLTSVVMSTNRSRAIGNRFPITMQQHLNECSTVMVNM